MAHSNSLILTLVGGFVLAFIMGMVALRLRLSPPRRALRATRGCGGFRRTLCHTFTVAGCRNEAPAR